MNGLHADMLKRPDRSYPANRHLRAGASALAVAGMLWGLPASATIISKTPSSGALVFGYFGANPDQTFGYGHWSEEIGSNPPFGTTQMDVEQTRTGTVITITTPFNIGAGDNPAQAADIAISTQSNGVYDLGIALGKQTQSAGLYSVSQWQTSRDLWTSQTGYVYGGEWTDNPACLGSSDPTCGNASYTPTRIFSGTELTNAVSVTQTGDTVTVDIEGLLLNQFSLLWGTADCGNDPIAGTFDVPEPASISLLCIGLMGVGLAARRRRAATAATSM